VFQIHIFVTEKLENSWT